MPRYTFPKQLSASDYIRSLIYDHSPKEYPSAEYPELITQLKSVSMRLTSLFHLLHITRQFDKNDMELLKKEMMKYKQILLDIQAAMLPEDAKNT